MPKVIQVIYHEQKRGAGTHDDVVRLVPQIYFLDGKLLMEHDPAPAKKAKKGGKKYENTKNTC